MNTITIILRETNTSEAWELTLCHHLKNIRLRGTYIQCGSNTSLKHLQIHSIVHHSCNYIRLWTRLHEWLLKTHSLSNCTWCAREAPFTAGAMCHNFMTAACVQWYMHQTLQMRTCAQDMKGVQCSLWCIFINMITHHWNTVSVDFRTVDRDKV